MSGRKVGNIMKAVYFGTVPAKSSNQLRLKVLLVYSERFNVIADAQLALVAAIGGGATVWPDVATQMSPSAGPQPSHAFLLIMQHI